MPVSAQNAVLGPEVVVNELFSSYPSGGDFFASQISRIIRANPDAIDTVLKRLSSAPAAQQKAVARAISSVVFALSASGEESQVELAQSISEKLAKVISCISDSVGDCPEYANQTMQQFADAYLSIQSGEATAAISAPFVAPGPIGVAPGAGGGPLGPSGDQIGGDTGENATATASVSLGTSNTPSARAPSSSSSRTLLLSPN